MPVKLGVSRRAGEDNFRHLMLPHQGHKPIQVTQGKLIQIIPIQRRVDLPPDAIGTAQVTRPGKEDVGEIVPFGHSIFLQDDTADG
jgi:hypothetical protein